MNLAHLSRLLANPEPMTDSDDRRRLCVVFGFVAAVILITLAFFGPSMAQEIAHQDDDRGGATASSAYASVRHARAYPGRVIGGRPSGCPRRFCGCALSIRRYGRIIPSLNLAWNWSRFPRTHASIGAVAVRRGHVLEIIGGSAGQWMTWDPNSGGGKIRIHQRNLSGFIFVNPSNREARL